MLVLCSMADSTRNSGRFVCVKVLDADLELTEAQL